MGFESLLSIIAPPAVHAKPDVGRINPEGQQGNPGQQRKRRPSNRETDPAHPVPNALGEITGKLIDTQA